MKQSIQKKTLMKVSIFLVLLSLLFIYRVGEIPRGIFTDEAQIAETAHQLLQGNAERFVNPFFYRHHDRYALGSLPVYANVPVVALFGLNDKAVRLSGALYSIAIIIVLALFFQQMSMRFSLIAVFSIAMTPVFYHLGRTNFGHSHSLLFVILAYYVYVKARLQSKQWSFYVLAGLLFAISTYGYGVFSLETPLFIASILFVELVYNRLSLNKYVPITLVLLVFVVGVTPHFYQMFTNAHYFERLNEKNSGNPTFGSFEKIRDVVANYPKYYDPEYLFVSGELGMKGSFITRHSVRGSGELQRATLLLFPMALVWILFTKNKAKKYLLPAFIFLPLYALPDAITTKNDSPPYAFTTYSMMIAVPFITIAGMQFLAKSRKELGRKYELLRKGVVGFVVALIFFEAVLFMRNYQIYPDYSSDYWGWQWGFENIMDNFKEKNHRYDDLYIWPAANAPEALLSFYDPDKVCSACKVGGYDNYDPRRNQLFSFPEDQLGEFESRMRLRILKNIVYPGGKIAFYIAEPINNE